MKINKSTKLYWARRGPNVLFGSHWNDRKEMPADEAEALFDRVWNEVLEPAYQNGRALPASEARALIPDDGRLEFFRATQSHRIMEIAGERLLAQYDPRSGEVTQMWHLMQSDAAVSGGAPAKGPSEIPHASAALQGDGSRGSKPPATRAVPLSLPSLGELAEFDKADLARLIGRTVTAYFLKI